MKNYNLLLLLFFVCGSVMKVHSCPLSGSSVSEKSCVCSADSLAGEKPYFIYQIVLPEEGIKSKGIKVKVDDGEDIKKLKDARGESIVFKTPAAVLMYFLSQGWVFYMNGSSVSGSVVNGTGVSYTSSYWIFRKSCSREEFDAAVKKGVKFE